MRSEEFWTYFATLRPQLDARKDNFANIFNYLDKFDHPIKIIETGSARKPDDWSGEGSSTILFDAYVKCHPGSVVHTIDHDPEVSAICRRLTSENVHVHTGDSLQVLKSFVDRSSQEIEAVDLLYLDSCPVNYDNSFPGAFHHLQEYIVISPLVTSETLVVIDDAPQTFSGYSVNKEFHMSSPNRIGGNGKLLGDYAEKIGAEIYFIGLQSGWIKLKAPSHGRPSDPGFLRGIVTVSDQGTFAVSVEDEFVGRHLRLSGKYGEAEIELFKKFLKPEDQALVVGAHVGTLAISFSKFCKHVTAIEANPWTYKLLKGNIAMNDANVTALHFAASDKTESIQFVMNTINSGSSKRMPLHRQDLYLHDQPTIVDVAAYRLDEKFPDQEFALVLMDIEGSEYFALKGMQKILSSARFLMVEYLVDYLKDVSGVTPEEFVEQIAPHFNDLYIFSANKHVPKKDFAKVLRQMYDHNQSDGGILFVK